MYVVVVVSLLRLPVLIGDSRGVRTARSMGQIRGPLLCSRPVTLGSRLSVDVSLWVSLQWMKVPLLFGDLPKLHSM